MSAAAVEQKFVRVFCVPTEITANHAPSTLRAHAQRAAAATHTPLELHSDSHGARGLPAAAPTLPTKSNQMEAGGEAVGKAHAPCVWLCGRTGLRWS